MLTPKQEEAIRRGLREKRSITQIAREARCTRSTVYAFIRREQDRSLNSEAEVAPAVTGSTLEEFEVQERHIELEETIKTLKTQAEQILNTRDFDPGEHEKIRAFVRMCESGLERMPTASLETGEAITDD